MNVDRCSATVIADFEREMAIIRETAGGAAALTASLRASLGSAAANLELAEATVDAYVCGEPENLRQVAASPPAHFKGEWARSLELEIRQGVCFDYHFIKNRLGQLVRFLQEGTRLNCYRHSIDDSRMLTFRPTMDDLPSSGLLRNLEESLETIQHYGTPKPLRKEVADHIAVARKRLNDFALTQIRRMYFASCLEAASAGGHAAALEEILGVIADDSAEEAKGGVVHTHWSCDVCQTNPIRGTRFKACNSSHQDLCQACFDADREQYRLSVHMDPFNGA